MRYIKVPCHGTTRVSRIEYQVSVLARMDYSTKFFLTSNGRKLAAGTSLRVKGVNRDGLVVVKHRGKDRMENWWGVIRKVVILGG